MLSAFFGMLIAKLDTFEALVLCQSMNVDGTETRPRAVRRRKIEAIRGVEGQRCLQRPLHSTPNYIRARPCMVEIHRLDLSA